MPSARAGKPPVAPEPPVALRSPSEPASSVAPESFVAMEHDHHLQPAVGLRLSLARVSPSKARVCPAEVRPVVPLLAYQREDVESEARLRWCCWSRQTGKSFTKSLRRILRGLKRGRTQIFLSSGERQSRELMLKARQHCQALKVAFDFHDQQTFRDSQFKQLEIRLPNRVRIIGLAANPQTARGYTGDVLLDEFAMHAEDRDIWAAMFPTLLRGDGELDVASTPKGCKNVFYDLGLNEHFSRSVLTLPQAVEQGLDVDVQAVRLAMGDEELFRQEFLCEFLDEASAFLTYEAIAQCEDPALDADKTIDELREWPGEFFVGVDIGRRRDLTVIWVLAEKAGAEPRAWSTTAMFVLGQAPFREQQALLGEILGLRQVRRCCMDAGGLGMQLAEWAVEKFGGHRVEPVMFTNALKSQLAGALRVAVENRQIRIPVDDALRNDWHSVQRTVTSGGHVRFEAGRAEGSHADRFWAAALALHATESGSGGVEGFLQRPLKFAQRGIW